MVGMGPGVRVGMQGALGVGILLGALIILPGRLTVLMRGGIV